MKKKIRWTGKGWYHTINEEGEALFFVPCERTDRDAVRFDYIPIGYTKVE